MIVALYFNTNISNWLRFDSADAFAWVIGFKLNVPFLKFLIEVDHPIKIIDKNDPNTKNAKILIENGFSMYGTIIINMNTKKIIFILNLFFIMYPIITQSWVVGALCQQPQYN